MPLSIVSKAGEFFEVVEYGEDPHWFDFLLSEVYTSAVTFLLELECVLKKACSLMEVVPSIRIHSRHSHIEVCLVDTTRHGWNWY